MSLLLPLLILIGALLVLVAEYRLGERPKSRKEKRKRTMILIGSLIVIGAAFFAARDSGIQQGRIETLATETKALVTGGNSFVWLAAVPMPAQDERFSVFLNHAGDTVPSFDIDIQFQNTGQCDGFPDRTMGNILASGLTNPRNVYIPALSSESVKFLPISLHPTCTDAYYLVLIQTRNRTILQQILLKSTAERTWTATLRVLDLNSDEILKELSIPGSAEKVDWPDESEFRDNYRQMQNFLDPEQD